MWNIDLTQVQQYYEKLVTLRPGHRGGSMKEVKKVNMVDVFSIHI
jgi:hypothetical protein